MNSSEDEQKRNELNHQLNRYLEQIEDRLRGLDQWKDEVMANITALSEAVATLTTDVEAVVTRLTEAAKPTQAEVDALTTQVTTEDSKLKTALSSATA